MGKPFKLKNDNVLLVAEAPGGVYNADQLKVFAECIDDEALVAKITEDQRLTVSAPEDKVEAIRTKFEEVGLGIRHYRDGIHAPVTCLGAQCPLQEQDALGDSFKVSDSLAGEVLDQSLRIGMNACSECCVPAHTLDIAAIGESNGYRMSIGGKNSQIPEMAVFVAEGIPADKLPDMIKNVVTAYKQNVEGDESLQEVVERVGLSPFVDVLAPYSQDAADDSDPFGSLVAENSSEEEDEADVAAEPGPDALEDIAVDEPADSSETEEAAVAPEGALAEGLEDIGSDASAGVEAGAADEVSGDDLGLDDLNVSADINSSQDLNDDLIVKEESDEAVPDIAPSELEAGSLDVEVPIEGGDDLSEDVSAGVEETLEAPAAEETVGTEEEVVASAAEPSVEEETVAVASEGEETENDVDIAELEAIADEATLEHETVDAEEEAVVEEVAVAAEEKVSDSEFTLESAEESLETLDTAVAEEPSAEVMAEDLSGLESDLEDDFSEEGVGEVESLDEDAESELEEKLDKSISEQADIGVTDDENLEERKAALEIVGDEDGVNYDLNSFEQEVEFSEGLDGIEQEYMEDATASSQGFSQFESMNFENDSIRLAFASGATLQVNMERLQSLGGNRTFRIDDQQIVVRIANGEAYVSIDGIEVSLAVPNAA